MDLFYRENAGLYRTLVKAFKPYPQSGTVMETANTDMIVGARIRPLLDEDVAAGFPCAVFPRSAEKGVVDIHDLYNHPRGRPILKSFSYQVDKLFDARASTEDIYEHLVAHLVPFVLDGNVGTLFAYGQTGSGKTFTVSSLEQLVVESLMNGRLGSQKQVSVSIIELAGNSAYDLLNSRKSITILEDSFGTTQLAGANEHVVLGKMDAMDLIERASSFRQTASTFKNDASSRSHSICRIRITDPSNASDGLLYLVDLAGSEAARDVSVHGADRMREAREINTSLSVLKECIRAKAQADGLSLADRPISKKAKPHVPFRRSALTKVLKHVFDPVGNRPCKTVVIACVNPSLADVGASKNTLRYAEMLRVLAPVADEAASDMTDPMSWTNTQLRDWITKNSGVPPIPPALVAPTESGAQFLRLPLADIESRCMKMASVSTEQAKAFQSKLRELVYIYSRRTGNSPPTPTPKSVEPDVTQVNSSSQRRASSRYLDPKAGLRPFKQRIRPGMVISWNPAPCDQPVFDLTKGSNLADVLCPADAAGAAIDDLTRATTITAEDDGGSTKRTSLCTSKTARYLCAQVARGSAAKSYELNLWQQFIIDVDMMEKEVFLEYDTGTRYYYISP